MADISQEQLERWLIRKTQAVEPVTGDGNSGIHTSISTLINVLLEKHGCVCRISPGLPPYDYGLFVCKNVEFLETTYKISPCGFHVLSVCAVLQPCKCP